MNKTIFCISLVAQCVLSTAIAGPSGGGGAAAGGSGSGASAGSAAVSSGNTASGGAAGNSSSTSTVSDGAAGNRILQPSQGAQNGDPTGQNNLGVQNNAGVQNGQKTISTQTTEQTGPNGTANANNNVNVNGNGNSTATVADQAVTAGDRTLLTTLNQSARMTLGAPAHANLPVHFMVNNGTVTLVGTVQNAAQSQNLMNQMRQTPGVISVVNGLQIAPQVGTQNNSGGFAPQTDRAFSPRDQALLSSIQQQTATQLGINNAAQMPVHFSIQGGVVGVTGQVGSLQEKQALLSAISKTPGIVRVVDNVGVQGGAASFNNGLQPTSRGFSSNTIFLNTNNASGF